MAVLEGLSQQRQDLRYELIYVNDGSRDKTETLLKSLCSQLPPENVRIVEFSRNFGHSAAVLAGLEASKGDYVAIIDADLQDPPELLPEMLKILENQTEGEIEVIYGQRVERENESIFKKFTAWGFYRLLNWLTDVEIPRDTGDFRIMKRVVVEAVLSCRESEPFIRGLVAWVGFRQRAFPYVRKGRDFGQTKYPFKRMLRFATMAMLSFSAKPLRLGVYAGIFGIVCTVGITAWALITKLRGDAIPGWTSVLGAFLSGQTIMFFIMGVIGSYVGQIYREVQKRPRFIVRESWKPKGN